MKRILTDFRFCIIRGNPAKRCYAINTLEQA